MRKFIRRHLTIIDRFIIKKYLGTFVFTLMIFMVISVVFDISEKLDNFLGKHASLNDIVFKYYAGFIPFYLNLLSPLINFLAVIFFTAKMANQTEIVPILTSKASFLRFLRPYFIASSLIFVVSFFANVYLIPFTNKLKITFENANFQMEDPTKSEVHIQLDKQTFVYLEKYDPETHTGYNFMLEKFDGDKLLEKLTAPTIIFDSLTTRWKINNPQVRLVNGLKENLTQYIVSKDTVLDMRPSDFEIHDNVYSAMSLNDLNKAIIKETTRSTGVITDMKFEKYRRFTDPLSAYVLAFIGVAISSRKVRGGVGLPLGIGIFICFTYIVVKQFALVFAIKGGFPPLISSLIPNLVFGLLAYILLIKAPK